MDEALVKIRHERSKKDFPRLRLEDDEYVEFSFRRAKVCLLMIIGGTSLGIIIVLLALLLALLGQSMLDEMGRNFLFIILSALLATAIIIGLVALIVYRGNRLFITNKRVIQIITESLVSTSMNKIDLWSVEDVSFRQNGILQKLFHYGTLRLATVGDETTYTFKHSDISSEELEAVSKLITDAKKRGKRKRSSEASEDVGVASEAAEAAEPASATSGE